MLRARTAAANAAQPGGKTMIRIGANPICWSNDDMIEIGGDIPLEQCLSEAREIGLEGMEKGNKFPTTAPELKAKLAEFGLVFISGWYSTFLLERDADAEFAAAQADLKLRKDAGAEVLDCLRVHAHGPWRQVGAALEAAGVDRRRVGRLPAAHDPLRGARQGFRAPARLPSSHGHGRSDGRGSRPFHGRHRPGGQACCSTPATSPGPAATRFASPRPTPTGLATSMPRTFARPSPPGRWPKTGRSSIRCSRASTPCPATARSTLSASSRPCPTIRAGS